MKTWTLKILELQMQVQPFESYNISWYPDWDIFSYSLLNNSCPKNNRYGEEEEETIEKL